MAKMKVFRMPIGFHDAFVAAPSRRAALAAWGSEHDLFARGVAEEVTDPALMEAPLAAPGTVIKRSRGSADEQLAALPPTRTAPGATAAKGKAGRAPAKPKLPRPTRDALDTAEAALAEAAQRHADADATLRDRIAALEGERKALVRSWDGDRARLERDRDEAEAAYDKAMRVWRG